MGASYGTIWRRKRGTCYNAKRKDGHAVTADSRTEREAAILTVDKAHLPPGWTWNEEALAWEGIDAGDGWTVLQGSANEWEVRCEAKLLACFGAADYARAYARRRWESQAVRQGATASASLPPVRVTPSMKEAVSEAAEEADMGVSAWIRTTLEAALEG